MLSRDEWKNLGESTKEQMVNVLAGRLHADWVWSYGESLNNVYENGALKPENKETNDQAWIEAHGTNVVDIVNTAFDELPMDMQWESKSAARVVVDIFVENEGRVNLEDSSMYYDVGKRVHDAWLERHTWAKDDPNLGVEFSELSQVERDKDIDQIKVGREVLGEQFSGESVSPPIN